MPSSWFCCALIVLRKLRAQSHWCVCS